MVDSPGGSEGTTARPRGTAGTMNWRAEKREKERSHIGVFSPLCALVSIFVLQHLVLQHGEFSQHSAQRGDSGADQSADSQVNNVNMGPAQYLREDVSSMNKQENSNGVVGNEEPTRMNNGAADSDGPSQSAPGATTTGAGTTGTAADDVASGEAPARASPQENQKTDRSNNISINKNGQVTLEVDFRGDIASGAP